MRASRTAIARARRIAADIDRALERSDPTSRLLGRCSPTAYHSFVTEAACGRADARALLADLDRALATDLDRALAVTQALAGALDRADLHRLGLGPGDRRLARARARLADLDRALRLAIKGEREGGQRVAPLVVSLLAAAARLLPVHDRARYAEEYRSELWDLARAGNGGFQQLEYALRQLRSALLMGLTLRSPRHRSAAP